MLFSNQRTALRLVLRIRPGRQTASRHRPWHKSSSRSKACSRENPGFLQTQRPPKATTAPLMPISSHQLDSAPATSSARSRALESSITSMTTANRQARRRIFSPALSVCFFHVNWLHDRWYKAGFDEASGNAQQDNFGLGGIGGDPVLAEGSDFSGTDNANMATPADGASPRMQMYEFIGPTPAKPSRTSNFEALITFHEMGHYITNRLIGNSNGLTNVQGGAMGEGWGDFFAICMTSQSTDDFATGTFAVGGWTDLMANFKENYYFSIRRYPYSADMAKNPLTFKHIANNVVLPVGPPINPISGGPNNEVHNAGEVWCAVLWEVFVKLVAKHGHAEAEKRILTYVIGGLEVTPLLPTYTPARRGHLTLVHALP